MKETTGLVGHELFTQRSSRENVFQEEMTETRSRCPWIGVTAQHV